MKSVDNRLIGTDKNTRIKMIDKLLSSGWVSKLDISIQFNENARASSPLYTPTTPPEYYKLLMTPPVNSKKTDGGKFTSAINQCFDEMADVWALVRGGTDIPGMVKHKKKGHKTGDKVRERFRKKFIEAIEISRSQSEEELSEYSLSDATLWYLRYGTNGQNIKIYRYIDLNYSIIEDKKKYDGELKDKAKYQRELGYTADCVPDNFILDSIPESEVIVLKRKAAFLNDIKNKLPRETSDFINEKLENIEETTSNKPNGWQDDISRTFSECIIVAHNCLNNADVAKLINLYGVHLINTKNFTAAQCVLEKGLNLLKDTIQSNDRIAKEKYALLLHTLCGLNLKINNYAVAEKQAAEGLDIFRELSLHDSLQEYGVALFQYYRALIHIEKRDFELVKSEFDEAEAIFTRIWSESDSTNYYHWLLECYISRARYYGLVGLISDSELVFSNTYSLLSHKEDHENDDVCAVLKAKTLIGYSSSLLQSGDYSHCENTMKEAIDILSEDKYINTYEEDLSLGYCNLGLLLYCTDKLKESLEYYDNAEVIQRKMAAANPYAYNSLLASTLYSQSVVFIGQQSVSISKLQEALSLMDVYHGTNNACTFTIQEGTYNFLIGYEYILSGDYEKAESYLFEAEKSFQSLFDQNSAPKMFEDVYSMTLACIGELYFKNHQKTNSGQSESYFKKALDVGYWFMTYTNCHNLDFLVYPHIRYGMFLFEAGKREDAMHYLTSGVDYFEQNANKHNKYNLNDIVGKARRVIAGIKLNANNDEQISSMDAKRKIAALLDEIQKLDRCAIDYRKNSMALYNIAYKYISYVDDLKFLADIICEFCKNMYEGYEYEYLIKFAPTAFNIYSSLVSEENENYEIRLKFIELLHHYCTGLEWCEEKPILRTVINKSLELFEHDTDNPSGDDANLYNALKYELLLDHEVQIPSDDSIRFCQLMLESCRKVSLPQRSIMCRLLVKAAACACDNQKWELAEHYILEAEDIVLEVDKSTSEEQLIFGEVYNFKGKYIQFTPLIGSDYNMYSHARSLEAYNKSFKYYEAALTTKPIGANWAILTLYLNMLRCQNEVQLDQQFINTKERIVEIANKLSTYSVSFIWQCVEALLELEFICEEQYLCHSHSFVDLAEYYDSSNSNYDYIASLISKYCISDLHKHSSYISRINDAKNHLKIKVASKLGKPY